MLSTKSSTSMAHVILCLLFRPYWKWLLALLLLTTPRLSRCISVHDFLNNNLAARNGYHTEEEDGGDDDYEYYDESSHDLDNSLGHYTDQFGWGGMEDDVEENYVAPKYMIELYNKFESDRYIHPMSNIVRSFVNIYQDPNPVKDLYSGYHPPTRRHMMKFNISSVTRDDEVSLAELRLYTLVEADRNSYYGSDREVALYEYVDDPVAENLLSHHEFLDSKDIYGSESGWETFTVTDAVRRWARNEIQVKTIEVRISTLHYPSMYPLPAVNIETQPHREHEPLLVVFSNDKKKVKSEKRELHEIIMHYETELASLPEFSADYDEEYEYYSYEDEDYEDNAIYRHRRDTRSMEGGEESDSMETKLNHGFIQKLQKSSRQRVRRSQDSILRKPNNATLLAYKRRILREMYDQLRDLEDEDVSSEQDSASTSTTSGGGSAHRSERRKRSTGRKRRKTSCRRKRMRVRFEDIHWHNWIIAPKVYEAYECTGRCILPVSDQLTPTKHAIIQTLLSTNFPKRAQRACCVPTKLDPISVLYVDEKGVVTYKHKYEGMVVAECGCR